MKGLLIKDLYSEKRNILIMIAIFTMANIGITLVRKDYLNPYFLMPSSNAALAVIIIMQDLLRQDKEAKTMAYTLAMPLKKKDFVNEKLIFAFIIILLVFLSNIFSVWVIKLITGVNALNGEFLFNEFVHSLLAFILANLGINFSFFADQFGFLLAMFPVFVGFLILISVFSADDMYTEIFAKKGYIAVFTLIFIVINEFIRRSSIKKMNKQRY